MKYAFAKSVFRLIAMAMLLGTMTARADVAPADWRQQKSEKVWQETLRPAVFPDRTINTREADKILAIKAPYRAEDATVVPISIHTLVPQTEKRYIRKIHVYVDKNPVPLVGVFEFTPRSGKADLALRIRVDDQSYVRAIAEMNDGKLYMVKSFVRATGACSAPPPPSIEDSFANMGRMKLRTVGETVLDKPNLVQLKIQHPNITGMQPLRIGSRVMPPPHYIKEITVEYNGKPVMKARLTFSISMDPSFRFFVLPEKAGVLHVQATDTKNNHWSDEYKITST
jgi:sulfur-oxidizing protein SoxY